jgi:hypothetical protein
MRPAPVPARYHAVALEFAACLDERCVEMHIFTATGETISVACPSDSIFAIQRHIERLAQECPEIATWGRSKSAG